MFKKYASFALFLAVTGLFAATSVDAQRLFSRTVKSSEPVVKITNPETTTFESSTLLEPVPENISVTIDQCANGGVGKAPQSCGANGTDANWERGAMNGNKAHYAEDGAIHYRAVFGDLSTTRSYTIVLGYDIYRNDPLVHTLDYLTNYNESIPNGGTEYQVIPCGAVAGCLALTPRQIAIPNDPTVPDSFETPANRFFTAWGIAPGATAAFIGGGAANERLIAITFTPTVPNPVFGWAGHIAATVDWGGPDGDGGIGASGQSGSSYHMYIRGGAPSDFNGSEDLQLSTDAIIAPSAAGVTIAGRVLDGYGRAISSAKLTLTNAFTGEVEVVYTNSFGYYKFEDVTSFDFFVMNVSHRRYSFPNGTVQFSADDNIAGMDFQASR